MTALEMLDLIWTLLLRLHLARLVFAQTRLSALVRFVDWMWLALVLDARFQDLPPPEDCFSLQLWSPRLILALTSRLRGIARTAQRR